jgi:hypothetical protein
MELLKYLRHAGFNKILNKFKGIHANYLYQQEIYLYLLLTIPQINQKLKRNQTLMKKAGIIMLKFIFLIRVRIKIGSANLKHKKRAFFIKIDRSAF